MQTPDPFFFSWLEQFPRLVRYIWTSEHAIMSAWTSSKTITASQGKILCQRVSSRVRFLYPPPQNKKQNPAFLSGRLTSSSDFGNIS